MTANANSSESQIKSGIYEKKNSIKIVQFQSKDGKKLSADRLEIT